MRVWSHRLADSQCQCSSRQSHIVLVVLHIAVLLQTHYQLNNNSLVLSQKGLGFREAKDLHWIAWSAENAPKVDWISRLAANTSDDALSSGRISSKGLQKWGNDSVVHSSHRFLQRKHSGLSSAPLEPSLSPSQSQSQSQSVLSVSLCFVYHSVSIVSYVWLLSVGSDSQLFLLKR